MCVDLPVQCFHFNGITALFCSAFLLSVLILFHFFCCDHIHLLLHCCFVCLVFTNLFLSYLLFIVICCLCWNFLSVVCVCCAQWMWCVCGSYLLLNFCFSAAILSLLFFFICDQSLFGYLEFAPAFTAASYVTYILCIYNVVVAKKRRILLAHRYPSVEYVFTKFPSDVDDPSLYLFDFDAANGNKLTKCSKLQCKYLKMKRKTTHSSSQGQIALRLLSSLGFVCIPSPVNQMETIYFPFAI